MMTKKEYIDYWIEQAEDDWSAVQTLFIGKNYLQSLFFTHLVIEKLAKALWVKHNNGNVPPKTHNILYIISLTNIEISEEQSIFLLNLNRFQLEGRYPDYRLKMHLICTKDFTRSIIDEANSIRLWLLKKLP